MVFRMELSCDETVDISDIKNIGAKTVGYTLQAGIKEINYLSLILKSLLTNEVKVPAAVVALRQQAP